MLLHTCSAYTIICVSPSQSSKSLYCLVTLLHFLLGKCLKQLYGHISAPYGSPHYCWYCLHDKLHRERDALSNWPLLTGWFPLAFCCFCHIRNLLVHFSFSFSCITVLLSVTRATVSNYWLYCYVSLKWTDSRRNFPLVTKRYSAEEWPKGPATLLTFSSDSFIHL